MNDYGTVPVLCTESTIILSLVLTIHYCLPSDNLP